MYEDKLDLSINGIRGILIKAEELYNKYRSPEATCRVIEFNEDMVKVWFGGHFCRSCGVNDWLEDFIYVLKDLGADADLIDIIEPSEPEADWVIGVFKFKNIGYESG